MLSAELARPRTELQHISSAKNDSKTTSDGSQQLL